MSKKLLAIFLSAVLLFTSVFTGITVLAETVTNLIDAGNGDDGGFEGLLLGPLDTRVGEGNDDQFERNDNYKWGYYNTWVVTPKIVENKDIAYEGTQYLQATAASGYMRPTGMLVPVDADTDYVFTFYAKSDITYTDIYAGVVTPAQAWPQTTIEETAKCKISGSDWTRYTIEFNSGDYTQLGLVFGGYCETQNTTDSYYVDDVALYKKEDVPTVTVSANGPGKVTSSHAYVVPGDEATLTATPNTDSKFLGWFANGEKISDEAVCTVSPTESTVYTAEFFGNLISDGGFDTATVGTLTNAYDPSGSNHLAIMNNPGTWYNFSTWILPGAIVESEGNKYINCTPANTSYFKYVGTAVNIEQNTDYVLMFNAKTNRTGVKGHVASALKTSGQHSTIDTSLANTAIDNGESWQTYSIAFSSGELTQVVLAFGLEVSNAAATDYYAIDDVKLYKRSGLAEVSVIADGAGNVSASADYVVPGNSVTLTATPENGAKFLGWYKGSDLVSNDAEYTVTVNEAVEYTAKFLGSLLSDGGFENKTEGLQATANPTAAPNTWGVYGTANGWLSIATVVNNSAEAKDGNKYLKVAGSGSYMRYMGVSASVTKNTDYVLTFWAKNDISYGNVIARIVGNTTNWATTAIQESAATTISTSSEWNSYTLEFNSGDYEQVSLVFGLNADTSNTTQSYSLDNISLYKKADLVEVTVKADGAGNVSASANYVVPGDKVTLTATPKNGAKFLGWYKGSVLVSNDATYTVTVDEAVEYTAKFFGSIIDGTFEAYEDGDVINTLTFTNEGTWGVYGKSGWQNWMTPSKIVEADGNKYLQSSKSGSYMNYTGIVVNNLTASTDYVVKFRAKNAISYTDIYAKVVGDSTNWGDANNAPSYTALTGAQVKIEKTDAWTDYAITFNTGDLTKVAVIFGAYTASASTDEAYCIDDVQLYKKSELAEVSVIADGAGDVTPKLDYVIPGDKVTLTATPENGAKFLGWYKDGELVYAENTYTVTVNEAVEYTAKFFGSIFADGSFESMTAGSLPKANPTAALNTWGVYASANTWLALGEIVDSSADAKDGSKYLKVTETAAYRRPMGVKVKVTKNTDYVLSFWAKSNIEAYTVSARVVGDTTNYSRTPIATDATVTIGKTDAWKQYAIAFNSGNYDQVTLVFGTYADDQTVETTYCIDNIALYNAEYVYNVNADSETVGTIGVNGGTVNGGGVYLEGDEVTLTAAAETKYGFELDGWYNGDTKLSDKAEYKFTVSSEMDNTINLTAKFVRSGINMIVNGDFESDEIEVSDIWQTISDRDYFEVVEDPAGGAQGKVLKANKDTAYGIFIDNVTLKAGHTYILKCKYYVAEKATHAQASNYERLGFWKVGGPSNFVSGDLTALGEKYAKLETGKDSYEGRWITASVTVSPTEDTTLSVAVGNCSYDLCNVDWYIDDIELYDRNDVMATAVDSGNGGNAAIRTAAYKDGNIDQNGLRIYNSIQKMALDSVVEYGAIVVRQAYLKAGNKAGWSGTKLTGKTFAEPSIEMVGVGGIGHGVAYRKAGAETDTGSTEIAHTLWSESASAYSFTAYVRGIESKHYDDEYLIRTYAIFADGTVAYGDTASASVFKVANAIDNANSPSDYDKAAFSTFVNNDEVASPLYQKWIDKSNGVYKVGKLYNVSRTATVSVLNDSTPLLSKYHGVSGTVYMPYTYFKDENGKRLYTDRQAKIELDRLGNSGFKTVRTYYKHSLAWDAENNCYDFDKEEIQWFIKWAKELQDRGLEISLSAPMRDASFATGTPDWENEALYILGHGEDKFGECTSLGVDLTGLGEYEARIAKAGARVAYWLTESLEYFKAQGLNNITYITYFTETDENTSTGEDFGDEYVTMVRLLHKALENAGMRKDYKIIGPNQADDMNAGITYKPVKKVLKHIKDTGEQIVDVVSAHIYPKAPTVSDETNSSEFIDDINTYAAKWKEILDDYGYTGEFWLDEYNVGFSDIPDGKTHDSAWAGTQFAATICRTVEYGVSNAFVWSFADQRWDDGTMHYVSGISRSIIESSVPYKRFYAIQMIARAMSHTDSKVYTVNVGDTGNETYAMCVEFEDGNWALMVVNTGLDNLTINTNFEASIGKTMYRHLYTPDIKADSSAAQISADKTFENVNDTLTDTIPVGGVAIYTSVQYE